MPLLNFKSFLEENYKTAKRQFVAAGADDHVVTDIFDRFRKLSADNKIKGDEKNIDWWVKNKSFDDLKTFVVNKEKEITKTQRKEKRVEGNRYLVRELKPAQLDPGRNLPNDKYQFIIPLDKDASCNIGKHTDWCTTKINQTYFEQYMARRIVLVYITKIDSDGNTKPFAAIAFTENGPQYNEAFWPDDSSTTIQRIAQTMGVRTHDITDILEKITKNEELMSKLNKIWKNALPYLIDAQMTTLRELFSNTRQQLMDRTELVDIAYISSYIRAAFDNLINALEVDARMAIEKENKLLELIKFVLLDSPLIKELNERQVLTVFELIKQLSNEDFLDISALLNKDVIRRIGEHENENVTAAFRSVFRGYGL